MRMSCFTALLVGGVALAPAILMAEPAARQERLTPWQFPQLPTSVQPRATGDASLLRDRQPQGARSLTPAPTDPVDAEIGARLRSMEQQLKRDEVMLNQQLSRAQQLRQQGLDRNDGQLLQQAEQIERQAVAQYRQRVEQFEQASRRLSQTTAARAEAEAAARQNASGPAQSEAATRRTPQSPAATRQNSAADERPRASQSEPQQQPRFRLRRLFGG